VAIMIFLVVGGHKSRVSIKKNQNISKLCLQIAKCVLVLHVAVERWQD
jgi:hypothetical protein